MEKENALTMKLFKPDPIVFERLTTCSLCNISFQNKRWVYINVLFSIFFVSSFTAKFGCKRSNFYILKKWFSFPLWYYKNCMDGELKNEIKNIKNYNLTWPSMNMNKIHNLVIIYQNVSEMVVCLLINNFW